MGTIQKVAAITLGLICLAPATSAQGYNSILIEVPYEISVPAVFESASIRCRFNNQPDWPLVPVNTISLVNGQARGTLLYGDSSIETNEDFTEIPDFSYLYRAANSDFEINVDCEILGFRSPTEGLTYLGEFSSGQHAIDVSNNPVWLEGDDYSLSATFTHADNIAGQHSLSLAKTTQIPSASNGLKGLQSILEGD